MPTIGPLSRPGSMPIARKCARAPARSAPERSASVVLIEGPAGIGKSAVLDESRRRAACGLRQLGARGGTLERDFGFGVVRQLLEVPARSREIPEAARAVLTDLGGGEAGASGEGSFAVLHWLLWVV